MKFKIAAIHSYLPIKAGAAGAFVNIVKFLKRKGHNIDVYTLLISEFIKQELQSIGVRVFDLNFKEWKLNQLDIFHILNEFRVMILFKKISKKINNEYEIAFVSHALYSPLILPFLKVPKIYYCYEPPRIYYEPTIALDNIDKLKKHIYKIITYPSKYIDKFSVKYADLILTNSDYIKEYVYRVYGKFAKTNYLGVNLEEYKKLDVNKENIIISVGILSPLKAHDFVVKSLALIPKSKRPKLIIITSGIISKKYEKYILKLATKYEVNIEIKKQYISIDEFSLLHSKAKLVVIPYIMEPSIEPVAFAYELPIVAIREGGAREVIIDGETGILTERDESEFAHAIEYLLDNPDIARKMGQKGKEWIMKNFTWEKTVERLEKYIKYILYVYRK